MIRLNMIAVDVESTIGKKLQCVETLQWKEYQEDGNGRILGTKYICLSPKLNYEKIVIKAEGPSVVDVEEHPVAITYAGPECKPYFDNSHNVNLSIKVSKVIPVQKA